MADFTKHTDYSSSSPPASGMSDMAGMEMSSGSHSMPMAMAFMVTTDTPLFSTEWTPDTLGQYAGSCIFLIVLAFVFRFLLAWKHVLEHRWAQKSKAVARRTIIAPHSDSSSSSIDNADAEKSSPPELVAVPRPVGWGGQPWRFSIDLPRAAMTAVITGVGYLLMLGVMTMNVGYFMSVLAGVFMGELVFGRFIVSDEHDGH